MKIGLHDSERNNYPNLALMKISAYHKAKGDAVEFYKETVWDYDFIYSAKIFTWTKAIKLPNNSLCGGTGYNFDVTLPDHIEHLCPDYSLYNCQQSYGFLTRGCPNKCPWCFVPKKEGVIRANADIEEFCRHKEVVLMDNNVLAHEHGLQQIEKIAKLGLKVDFNQGLDARLIDASVAKLLSKLKWLHPLRLACDSSSQIESIRNAVNLLRWYNVTPRAYFCYVLIKDVNDALERIYFLKGMGVDPFAQPYRDIEGTEPTKEQKRLARWCNHKAIFKSVPFEDYK